MWTQCDLNSELGKKPWKGIPSFPLMAFDFLSTISSFIMEDIWGFSRLRPGSEIHLMIQKSIEEACV